MVHGIAGMTIFLLPSVLAANGTMQPSFPLVSLGGAAAILLGLMTLTIQYTMGPTHTWGGVNYANAFHALLTAIGLGLLLLGAMLLGMIRINRARVTNRYSFLNLRG